MKNKLGIITVLIAVVALLSPNMAEAGGGPIYMLENDMDDAKVGTHYSGTIDFNNDNGSAVTVFISNLPPGISINGSGYDNMAMAGPSGTYSIPISGTPTAAGSYAMFVSIAEQSGSAGGQGYVYIDVNPASTSGCRIKSFTAYLLTPQVGDSSTLSWSTTGCKSAQVVSSNEQGNAFSVPLSTKLSGSVSTGALPAGSAYYRLAASAGGSADPISAEAQSNVAIHVAPGAPSTSNPVTLISPNGGQTYKVGDTLNVNWSTSSIVPDEASVYIYLYKLNSPNWDPNNASQYIDVNGSYGDIANFGTENSDGHYSWKIPDEFANRTGSYAIQIRIYDFSSETIYAVEDWSDGYFTIASQVTVAGAHAEGTNILGTDGTVYRIVGNARSPYTSAGAYLSYKFNSWSTTVPANSADMSLPIGTYTPTGGAVSVPSFIPPRNGALINDNGTVYLITGGGRAGFATAAMFIGLGFSFTNVYPGDTSFMGLNYEPINSTNLKHHDGVLINDNGTLYVMRNGYRVGFPSMAVLDSWGYWVTDAVPANSYDRAAEVSGVMQTRMANQLSI